MSDAITLPAEQRTITGKKVKQLRNQGLIPAVVYGPEFDAMSLQINQRDLRIALRDAGGTQIIEIQVGGDSIPTLARDVQRDPIYGHALHVDFYRVDLTKVIRAEVPIVIVGESPIVASGEAVISQVANSLEVEALPAELPPQIEIDISGLEEVGLMVTVGELNLADGVVVIANEDDPIVKLDYPTIVEEEEEEEELDFFDDSVEPEVITESKEDEEDEEE